MCTLTLAWRVFEEAPVVVAANRDEADDRPSEPPARRSGDPAVVAPRDVEAGGTWIGYNDDGLFVGITNRWVGGLEGERSRGLLVSDALRRPTADAAARFVEESTAAHRYEGFNLVVADADSAVYLEWDGALHVRELDPGVHVVVNVGADGEYYEPPRRPDLGAAQAENALAVREALDSEAGEAAASWLDRAAAVLGDHDYGVCIHRDGYGTRSSSLLALFADGTATYRFADGPPCETPFRPVDVAPE